MTIKCAFQIKPTLAYEHFSVHLSTYIIKKHPETVGKKLQKLGKYLLK